MPFKKSGLRMIMSTLRAQQVRNTRKFKNFLNLLLKLLLYSKFIRREPKLILKFRKNPPLAPYPQVQAKSKLRLSKKKSSRARQIS